MRKWMCLFIVAAPLLSGCAQYIERQRLKTEMMREAVGMMKGMNSEMPGGTPNHFAIPAATPVPAPAESH